jgi:hypothetical protein
MATQCTPDNLLNPILRPDLKNDRPYFALMNASDSTLVLPLANFGLLLAIDTTQCESIFYVVIGTEYVV